MQKLNKIMFYGSIILFYILLLTPISVFAAPVNNNQFQFGVSGYPDSQYVSSYLTGGSAMLIATTTSYTVLSYSIVENTSSGTFAGLTCGTTGAFSDLLSFDTYINVYVGASYGFTKNSPVHCNGNLIFNSGSGAFVSVQYVPYDTQVNEFVNPNDVTYHDWILVIGIFFFIFSFGVWREIFSFIKRKRPYN